MEKVVAINKIPTPSKGRMYYKYMITLPKRLIDDFLFDVGEPEIAVVKKIEKGVLLVELKRVSGKTEEKKETKDYEDYVGEGTESSRTRDSAFEAVETGSDYAEEEVATEEEQGQEHGLLQAETH